MAYDVLNFNTMPLASYDLIKLAGQPITKVSTGIPNHMKRCAFSLKSGIGV